MTDNLCRPETVTVDGQEHTVLVRGNQPLTDLDRRYLAEIVAAVQAKVRADPRHAPTVVLLEHQRDGRRCRCGAPARLDQQWAKHVVEQLAAAGLLTNITASGSGADQVEKGG